MVNEKMDSFPLLQIKNLFIGFAQGGEVVPAVKGLNLEVDRGEIVALVGESGSGKSVTALSILQLLALPPSVQTSGAILFSERGELPVNLLQHKAIQQIRGNRIGMIFQEPMSALNPVMTCGRQVQEVLMQHKSLAPKAAKAATIGWLEKVQIPDPQNAYHKYPHQMSGGQKQRVMIAMAMCCSPALLLCDEPTTALDVTVQQHILELIKELQRETGMGVLFITHDLGVVAQIADKVAIIYRGELVERGTTQQIFTAPGHAYTKALVACRPAAQAKGSRLPIVSDFLEGANSTAGSKQVPEPIIKADVLVAVKNLSVSFTIKRNIWGAAIKTFTAVDGVCFEIYRGETLGLVGESGCGKTTLGRSLLRLAAPSGGNIFISGNDITALDNRYIKSFRKDVQLVFQDPFAALNPRLTIGDALEEPLLLQQAYASGKERRKKVSQLLDLVQLPAEAARRYPHQFSGGQRQRIVIARALVPGPHFLVCDESVSALDVSVQAQVLNLLNDLKNELGLTLLFISHDLGVVRYMSDRIMVMQKGKIVESGLADGKCCQCCKK
jgi:peptide/nickel transport system ATP-binding protein